MKHMENNTFNEAIENLRLYSSELAAAEADHAMLVNLLNALSTDSRMQLHGMYQNAEGPVKAIRKQVSEILIERNIEIGEVEGIIQKAITSNPRSFGKMYKSWFNMLYMFLIADIRPAMTAAISIVSDTIIKSLGAEDTLVAKKFDFSGERETGSTRCWIAFINKSHPGQTTAKQLFLNIQNGGVECSFYDRPNEAMSGQELYPEGMPFGIDEALSVFEEHMPEIIADIWMPVVHYWRIGTSDGHVQYWDEMLEEKKICIGWPDTGNLNETEVRNKKSIIQLFEEAGYYPDDNRTRSRKAGEVFNFYDRIREGDIVLAQRGANVLGIGRVTGGYQYDGESDFPHQRPVDWVVLNPSLDNEIGLQTSVYQIEDKKIQAMVKQLIANPEQNDNMDKTLTGMALSGVAQPANQILFGPPGTGKTYNSIKRALKCIEEEDEQKLDWGNWNAVKELFDKRVADGRIVFTTFHQSMSYEDFVEGIKPEVTEAEQVTYSIKPGIFKILCNKARTVKARTVKVDWENVNYYKMSLGGKNNPNTHEWCLNNNVVALGWGGDNDLKSMQAFNTWREYRDEYTKRYPELVKESRFHVQATYAFLNMRAGDVVVASMGNHIIDAIGIVEGSYYWDDQSPFDFYHYRKVNWIAKNLNMPPDKFFDKQISQMSVYQFYNDDVKIAAFEDITNVDSESDNIENSIDRPYVLIIDEINRGNVSAIFGELITLIEENKRLGKPEALEAILPYSKERFGVPSNLFIIGTMNTADRSVEALDTALRRRFSFEEIAPQPDLINNMGKLADQGGRLGNISLSKLLTIINRRIEKLLDKDHQIGHSYLLQVESMEGLQAVFYQNIIPLLQEYFYGDYGKIGLVLGRGFVAFKSWNDEFADFSNENVSGYEEREVYEIIDYRLPGLVYKLAMGRDTGTVEMNFEKAVKLLMKLPLE
jgi:predicted Mrr-cat superfamily restriction endonuclease